MKIEGREGEIESETYRTAVAASQSGAQVLRLAAAALVHGGSDMATAQLRRRNGALMLSAAVNFERPFIEHFAVVDGDGDVLGVISAHYRRSGHHDLGLIRSVAADASATFARLACGASTFPSARPRHIAPSTMEHIAEGHEEAALRADIAAALMDRLGHLQRAADTRRRADQHVLAAERIRGRSRAPGGNAG